MELSRISALDKCFFSPSIRYSSSPHPLSALSTFFTATLCENRRHILRRRSYCSASNPDTLLAGGDSVVVAGKKHEEEEGDLKSWMHKHGLPPCKVVLKERAPHNDSHKPIHYVAASQDLQVGDVAFSVPNSLVVTLERVLGNETVGNSF